MSNEIQQHMSIIKQRIRQVQQELTVKYSPVLLLGVSKGQAVSKIRDAYAAGLRAFGENYLQEALTKQQQCQDLAIEWHFIGRIQRNKTRLIAEHFSWVHSVADRIVAERLAKARPGDLSALNLCLQVNISGETSKAGLLPDAVPALVEYLQSLSNIRCRGLMTIPPATANDAEKREIYHRLRELRDDCQDAGIAMDTLSMGMSNDYTLAVAEGATIVRIGRDLFGPRADAASCHDI